MLAVASGCLLLPACGGTLSSFCPPDQLQTQPVALLQACQPPLCLLPDDFSTLSLDAQAGLVGACHEADIKAWTVCAAKHQELADWVKARKVAPKD